MVAICSSVKCFLTFAILSFFVAGMLLNHCCCLAVDVCIAVCRKVATLQLLAGYLQLAGGHVTLMVHSVMHLTKLVQALLEVRVQRVCVRRDLLMDCS